MFPPPNCEHCLFCFFPSNSWQKHGEQYWRSSASPFLCGLEMSRLAGSEVLVCGYDDYSSPHTHRRVSSCLKLQTLHCVVWICFWSVWSGSLCSLHWLFYLPRNEQCVHEAFISEEICWCLNKHCATCVLLSTSFPAKTGFSCSCDHMWDKIFFFSFFTVFKFKLILICPFLKPDPCKKLFINSVRQV